MRHFKGFLAQEMEEYISYRLSLGYMGMTISYTDRNLRGQLRAFDRYVCDKEAGPDDLRPPFFLDFKESLKEKPQTFNADLLAMR